MITLITRPGIGKDHSEDAVLAGNCVWIDCNITLPFESQSFVCVADGVGGQQCGEVASSYVLNELSGISGDDLRNQIIAINDRLIAKGAEDSTLAGMATTLTGVYFGEESSVLLHIGNSRAYVLQGGYFKQITSDHTLYNWLKSTGRYDDAEQCNKNEIIGCMGGGSKKLLEKLYISNLPSAHTLLLTSDGVHDYVELDELERIFALPISDMDKCQAVLDLAVESGSNDDLTIVLIRND